MRPEKDASAPTLSQLQAWLQAVVVHPATVEEALSSPEASALVSPDRVGETVKPSRTMTPTERLEVYHSMYLLRMAEALETDYPLLRRFLGEEDFTALVRDYVQFFPSRSYTLNRLGDHLPSFLAAEPAREHGPFLADLARFELAETQVFDEENSPVLSGEDFASVPPEAWPGAVLKPVKAFRLLTLGHSVIAHLDAYKEDKPVPPVRKRATRLALARKDDRVFHVTCTRAAYGLLKALRDGSPLGEALAAAASGAVGSSTPERLFEDFQEWTAAGFFSGVVFPEPSA